MKKNVFYLSMALATLASCTNDEVTEVAQNRAIRFDSFVNNGTRTDVTTDKFAKFYVFGEYNSEQNWVDVFNNVEVAKSGNTWTYNGTQYWEPKKVYNFGAYADGTAKLETGVEFASTGNDAATLKFTNYTINENHTNDLVAALATNKEFDSSTSTAPAAVAFTFNHLLSKVKFTFNTNSSELYSFKVTDLQIVGDAAQNTGAIVKSTCTYDGNAASWDNTKNVSYGAYKYAANDGISYSITAAGTSERYVIPQATTDLKATFTVTVTQSNPQKTATANFEANLDLANGASWAASNVYNYTATIDYDDVVNKDPEKPTVYPIEFTVTSVGVWDSSTDTPVTPTSQEEQPQP